MLTGKLRLTYKGHSEVAFPLTWSPDGKYIISAGGDGTNQMWEAMTGKRIHTFEGASGAVAWSPDGKYIASGGSDKTVQVWIELSYSWQYQRRCYQQIRFLTVEFRYV